MLLCIDLRCLGADNVERVFRCKVCGPDPDFEDPDPRWVITVFPTDASGVVGGTQLDAELYEIDCPTIVGKVVHFKRLSLPPGDPLRAKGIPDKLYEAVARDELGLGPMRLVSSALDEDQDSADSLSEDGARVWQRLLNVGCAERHAGRYLYVPQ